MGPLLPPTFLSVTYYTVFFYMRQSGRRPEFKISLNIIAFVLHLFNIFISSVSVQKKPQKARRSAGQREKNANEALKQNCETVSTQMEQSIRIRQIDKEAHQKSLEMKQDRNDALSNETGE